jgi:hypothetical protein
VRAQAGALAAPPRETASANPPMSPEARQPAVMEALATLNRYLQDELSLDALIEWAEGQASVATDDVWLHHVVTDLANPLLCREQAMALVREHLRVRKTD